MNVNSEENSTANLSSANKMNNKIFLKSEIKDEPMDDNSLFPTDYVDDTVESKCDYSEINSGVIGDTKTGLEMGINWKETGNKMNKEIFSNSETKDEPMDDDNSLFPTDYADDTVESNCDNSEINWKETGSAKIEINTGMSIKTEIKNEPMDDKSFIFLPEYVDNTINSSSNDDGSDINCEDPKKDIDTSGNLVKFRSSKVAAYTDKCEEESKRSITGKSEKHKSTENKYQCDVCKKSFSHAHKLTVHKRIHSDEKPYQCDVCNKRFNQLGHLTRHKRIHTGEKPYQCDVCKKCFGRSSDLKTHNRVHTGEKPYQCDICKKNYKDISNLIVHKRMHTDEKPYQCDVCKKCFGRSSELKKHNRVHTGEKPYQCEFCKKSFRDISNLIVHKRVHTDEKPYQCGVCKKSFGRSSILKTHIRVHTGERPYQCDVCKKSFSAINNFIVHKRTHNDQKPYRCDVCKKCFARSSVLKRHSRVHTGEKPKNAVK